MPDYLLYFFRLCRLFSSCSEQGLLSSCSARASHCGGFSRCRARVPDVRAPVVAVQELSCPTAHGILPDQGSNPCLLHWQADLQPLDHQGSPIPFILWSHILFFSFLVYTCVHFTIYLSSLGCPTFSFYTENAL